MRKGYKIALTAIALCMSLAFIVGTSYAIWTIQLTQPSENTFVSGCFSIAFTDSDVISMNNAYPMSDTKGLATTAYTATVQNTCNIAANVNITLNILNTTTIGTNKIKMDLSGAKTISKTLVSALSTTTPTGAKASLATTAYDLGIDRLDPNATKTYNLRLWIDEAAGNEVMGQTFVANMVFSSTAVVS